MNRGALRINRLSGLIGINAHSLCSYQWCNGKCCWRLNNGQQSQCRICTWCGPFYWVLFFSVTRRNMWYTLPKSALQSQTIQTYLNEGCSYTTTIILCLLASNVYYLLLHGSGLRVILVLIKQIMLWVFRFVEDCLVKIWRLINETNIRRFSGLLDEVHL